MVSRNFSRRLEQLEECVLPPESRVVLRIVFVNTDGTVAPCGFTIDPWSRAEERRPLATPRVGSGGGRT
jgi:hypothetical protein